MKLARNKGLLLLQNHLLRCKCSLTFTHGSTNKSTSVSSIKWHHLLPKHPIPDDCDGSISPPATVPVVETQTALQSRHTLAVYSLTSSPLPLISFNRSLLLFLRASTPDALRPTPHDSLSIPKAILLNEALQGGSFGLAWRQGRCQGTLS